MRHLPSLKHMQYFIALAEQGSFTKAANHCHVTQSTLSAGIAALENALDQMLVDRSHKNIVLTPYGEDTLRTARQVIVQMTDLLDRATQLQAPLSGPLRLGLIPTIAPYFLPLLLPSLRERYPALELEMHEDLSRRLVAGLHEGALDLVLMAFPYQTNGLTRHHLFDEPFMLACPQGRWTKKVPVKTAALDSHDLLLLEEGHCLRDHVLAACKLQPPKDRRSFNAASLQTLIEMVRHGYGMTLLPSMAASSIPQTDQIDILPFAAPPPTRQIGLAWRENHARTDEFLLFAELAANAYRAHQW